MAITTIPPVWVEQDRTEPSIFVTVLISLHLKNDYEKQSIDGRPVPAFATARHHRRRLRTESDGKGFIGVQTW